MIYSDFKGKRGNVTCIMYLEDWGIPYGDLLEFLANLKIPCACSPVHDRDTFSRPEVDEWIHDHTVNGKLTQEAIDEGIPEVDNHKKSHVHVMFCASDGPRDLNWWQTLLMPFHKINYFQSVKDKGSLLRYFAHMDNPEKTQYNMDYIHAFGGLDTSALHKSTESDKINTLIECMEYIFENKVRAYHKLVRYAFSTGDYDLINCVSGRSSFFVQYFKSENDEFRMMKKWRKLLEKYPLINEEELEEVFK